MKQFSRHIIVCLFLFMGVMSYASHILGGEITYQHLKNDQYRVTLNIYRDCNGCKINGKGGGKSSENCAEIEYLFVRGKNGSTTKETRFPLYRENIQDITTGCRSLKSACTDLPNSVFGIELHSFYSIVDLSQGSISGFCDYYFYVSIAERNSNISTGQASQNFFIDAYLNACTSEPVSSPNFVSPPVLISNNNVNQFQSYHCENTGDDSVSYTLCPALIAFETDATYKTGFSYLNPITSYCPGTPCTPDPTQNPPIGVSFNKNNGSLIFMPTLDGERGIIAVKAEKFRKINGKWSLVSFIKRDLQLSIKTSDGNHTPTFLSKNYFEICEEELLEFKVETYDLKNSITNIWDTVHLSLNSPMAGPVLTEQYQGQAPFVYGTFNWRPQKGNQNVPSIYTFSITATDNNCPLEANSVQLIQV
ncbi:MAG: hypothetical protein H6605_09760, partial [Flavobacteriales bacterium]|nr:hypothetical protein [Flavobacteriales bacterium]